VKFDENQPHKCGPLQFVSGSEAKSIIESSWPQPRIDSSRIRGEILFIDQFGNAISNISNKLISTWQRNRSRATVAEAPLSATHYQNVPTGKPVAMRAATGFVEIARTAARRPEHWP